MLRSNPSATKRKRRGGGTGTSAAPDLFQNCVSVKALNQISHTNLTYMNLHNLFYPVLRKISIDSGIIASSAVTSTLALSETEAAVIGAVTSIIILLIKELAKAHNRRK